MNLGSHLYLYQVWRKYGVILGVKIVAISIAVAVAAAAAFFKFIHF